MKQEFVNIANAVAAAERAGVKFIAYTSLVNATGK